MALPSLQKCWNHSMLRLGIIGIGRRWEANSELAHWFESVCIRKSHIIWDVWIDVARVYVGGVLVGHHMNLWCELSRIAYIVRVLYNLNDKAKKCKRSHLTGERGSDYLKWPMECIISKLKQQSDWILLQRMTPMVKVPGRVIFKNTHAWMR